MLKAVILAGGKSTRTYPLTLTRPKPILPVAGTELIVHNLIQLSGLVDEVVFIVGYKKEMFIKNIKAIWKKWGFSECMTCSFVEQVEQKGTAHAVLQAEKIIDDSFFVLNGDDLYSRGDLLEMSKLGPSILAQHLPDVSRFSSILTSKDNNFIFNRIIEKPEKGGPGLAGLGMYLFDPHVFEAIKNTPLSERGEYEMTEALNLYAINKKIMVHVVKGFWIPVGYPWSVIDATARIFQSSYYKKFTERLKLLGYVNIHDDVFAAEDAEISDDVKITGPAVIGSNTIIDRGTVISGPAYVGNNCHVGRGVNIESCVTFDSVEIGDNSVIKYSVIGAGSKFGESCRTEYMNNTKTPVFSKVKDSMESTGMDRLGLMCADNVSVGKNCIFKAGVKVNPDVKISDNTTVEKDII